LLGSLSFGVSTPHLTACTEGISHEQPVIAHARAQNGQSLNRMSLLLTICLTLPGACETTYLDQIEAIAAPESARTVERWRPLVATQFPASEVDTALCIIEHESSGNPRADNPRSSARGLFQVLGSLWAPHYGVSRSELFDPVTNTRIAADIWENQGWRAWSPYQRGSCRSG